MKQHAQPLLLNFFTTAQLFILYDEAETYRAVIRETEAKLIYNHGCAAKFGADYILRSLSSRKNK